MRTFLAPAQRLQIDDTWHVAGLKGTGSKDIVVEGAFVPEHRTHKLIDGFKRNSPGNAVNPAPLFRLPFGQIFVRSVSTSAIGIAQGALDAYRDVAAKRIAAERRHQGGRRSGDAGGARAPRAHRRDASSSCTRNFDEMMASCRAGKDIPVERRVRSATSRRWRS